MTLRSVRNLVRCVTPRRIGNLLAVMLSYRLSLLLRRSVVWGRPYTLTIEPTNRCNLKCPECPSGNGDMVRPLGLLDFDRFRAIVDEVHGEVFYLQLFFQGEPFINNRLVDMIAYARAKRMYVSISTNAHFLRREVVDALLDAGLDRLIVSLDGLTQEVYEEYRVGGSLAKVHEALALLDETRRRFGRRARTEVTLQFLVTRQNESQIPELRGLAQKHNAGVALKTMQVYSLESAERFLPRDERYSRYHVVDGELRPKSALRDRCVRLWERSVITWEGVVVPCCFDKNAEYPLGRLDGRDFADVWQSEEYHAFRLRVLQGRRDIPMCRNCTEGLKIYR
ncbi:MAG: SPASM domain-containing protein [Bacteroidetes bacterium]|nr:SPASM domain-containing protein [Bacteroidota bacterium]